MITLEVFIGNDYLGKADAGLVRIHEGLYQPFSVAYLCPECGELWGRAMYRSDGKPSKWTAYSVSCVKCKSNMFDRPSGLIFNGGSNDELLKHLPRQALEREFLLWYEYTRKHHANI